MAEEDGSRACNSPPPCSSSSCCRGKTRPGDGVTSCPQHRNGVGRRGLGQDIRSQWAPSGCLLLLPALLPKEAEDGPSVEVKGASTSQPSLPSSGQPESQKGHPTDSGWRAPTLLPFFKGPMEQGLILGSLCSFGKDPAFLLLISAQVRKKPRRSRAQPSMVPGTCFT